jgi:PST family polysaccharide transporter
VAPAAFAAVQHDPPRMRATFTAVTGVLAAATIPCCLVIAGASAPLVSFIYGAAWQPAAGPLLWLGVFAAFRILCELTYDYLVVLGRSGSLLRVQIIGLICTVPLMLWGAHLAGIIGIAVAQVVVAAVVTLPIYLAELRRVGLRVVALLRRIGLPAAGGVLVGGAAHVLGEARITGPFTASVLSGVLALVAAGALLVRDRRTLAQLRATGPSRVTR